MKMILKYVSRVHQSEPKLGILGSVPPAPKSSSCFESVRLTLRGIRETVHWTVARL